MRPERYSEDTSNGSLVPGRYMISVKLSLVS